MKEMIKDLTEGNPGKVLFQFTMIFMAIALGCNVGCSVVISQLFGAKRYREMKTAIYTTLISSLVLSTVLTILGMACSKVSYP